MLSIFKKALVASVALAGLASLSQASTVNFIMQYNDNGTNTYTAPSGSTGQYAVYLSDSTGDNAGISAFTTTLNNVLTVDNMAPWATYVGLSGGAGLYHESNPNETFVFADVDNSKANYFVGGMGQQTGSLPPLVNGNGTSASVSPNFGLSFEDGTHPMLVVTGTYNTATLPTMDWLTSNALVFFDVHQLGLQASSFGPDSGVADAFNGNQDGSDFAASAYRTLAPIPEPASLGVLALGGLALLARRRKA